MISILLARLVRKNGRAQAGRWLAWAAAIGLAVAGPARPVLAQQRLPWAPVASIPGYSATTLPPVLVADQNHTVHAFASQSVGDPDIPDSFTDVAIVYRQWTADGGWTKPNDIILSPLNNQARVEDVYLDDSGVMHLVFFGGDDNLANIYYTAAPAADAANARAWAAPVLVGPGAITPNYAALAGDAEGRIVVVYSGNLGEGNSLYAVYSDDNGITWSEPETVFSTFGTDEKVFDFSISMGESGSVHAVWNVTNKRGQNVASYYAKLDGLATKQWSEPVTIDQGVGLGIAVPAVIEYQGAVFNMFNNGVEGAVAPVQWFRRSDDGGVSWSEPQRPFPTHIGRNGSTAFVVDGNGDLHVFFGERIPGPGGADEHGMWHSRWQGSGWGPLTAVISGPPTSNFDPYDARAIVSQGNVILLTWRTDPGAPEHSTWYSYATLDAPEAPTQPLPAVVPALAATPAADSAGPLSLAADLVTAPALQPAVATAKYSKEKSTPANPGLPLVVGVGAALLLTVFGVAIRSLNRGLKG